MSTRTLASAQETFTLDDDVDFYRKPDQKDLPGWTGPAKVRDMSQADRGIIIVDYRGRKLTCDPQNLRQHQAFLCFLTIAPLDHPCTQAAQHIHTQLGNLPPMTTIHLGYLYKDNQWHQTPDTTRHPSLWNATKLLAQLLHIEQQHAATRVSNHPSKITSITDTTLGYQDQITLLWEQEQPLPYCI